MDKVDLYIKSVEDELRPLVKKLRETIKSVSPELEEDIKWSVPTYSLNKNICSIMAHKKHVNIQVFRGAHIKDAELLIGTGKDMRHIKYENLSDLKVSVLKKIIKQAVVVDSA